MPSDDGSARDDPPVELRDTWSGPRKYAEDFYAAGDVPEDANNAHLLPTEVEGLEEETTEVTEDDGLIDLDVIDSQGEPPCTRYRCCTHIDATATYRRSVCGLR